MKHLLILMLLASLMTPLRSAPALPLAAPGLSAHLLTGGELTIAQMGKPISAALKSKLLNAFKAQFGSKAKVESIELIPFHNAMWLVFQSGERGTQTIALKLDEKKGAYVLNASTTEVNTCTGNPCSYCKFSESVGCYCNQGGGSSSCNHTVTSLSQMDRFMAVLEL